MELALKSKRVPVTHVANQKTVLESELCVLAYRRSMQSQLK